MDTLSNVSQVPQNVNALLKAAEQHDRTKNEIAYAVLGKQQDAVKQSGAAINEMLSQAVDLQSQLAENRLDIQA